MPINESEIVQMVTSLQGIVDDQTLLGQLWFIKDPAEALENIKRQKQENIKRQKQENQEAYQHTFQTGDEAEEEEAERKSRRFLTDEQ